MTKKDFEFIAGLLAKRESDLAESEINVRLAHRRTVMAISSALADSYPRFKRGIFEAAALPLHTAARADQVKAMLQKQEELRKEEIAISEHTGFSVERIREIRAMNTKVAEARMRVRKQFDSDVKRRDS